MRLKSISLSKLHQTELISFVEDVIGIIEKHNMRALHLEDSSGMLLLHYPDVIKLAKGYSRSLVAERLKAIHIKRVEYAGFIFMHAISLRQLKGDVMNKETLKASFVVSLHLKGIRKNNRPTVCGKLWGFFNTLDNDLDAKQSFQVLGLLSYAEELREINKLYNEVYELYAVVKVEKSKRSENKAIQKKAETILRIFFTQLKQAQEIYPELQKEYAPIYAVLNQKIPKYTKLIRTRATLNKKRAAAKAKAAADAEAKVHILCVNGKESGLVTIGGQKNEKKKAETKKEKQARRKSVAKTKKKDSGSK